MSEEKTDEQIPQVPEICGAVKRGAIDVTCGLPLKHDDWHMATLTDRRTVSHPGAVHEITSTETVTWRPNWRDL